MRRVRPVNIFAGLVLLVIPFTGNSISGFQLLSDEDVALELQQKEELRPALSSPLDDDEQWEAYNQWLCFSVTSIELACSEVDYGGWRKIPSLRAHGANHRFEFDVSPERDWDCEATLQDWSRLLESSSEICVFAARLQPIDENSSLWYIERIKTTQGYWIEHSASKLTSDEPAEEFDE